MSFRISRAPRVSTPLRVPQSNFAFGSEANGFVKPFADRYSLAPFGAREMTGGLKAVRLRIRTVKSIQKITKTMKMIASAKLRDAQQRMEKAKVFADMALHFQSQVSHAPAKKTLILAFGADRGLCGAINAYISRTVRALVRDLPKETDAQIIAIGDKPSAQLARDQGKRVVFAATQITKRPPNFELASLIAQQVVDLPEKYENTIIIYNKFLSAIQYKTTHYNLTTYPTLLKDKARAVFEVDGFSPDGFLQDFNEFQYAITAFGSIVEGYASELAARMAAMDNAARNAGDMLKRLTLLYNRGRQAQITKELIEIVGGAESLKQEGL
jgi:F-type H+-transporting ATPase subunit gamma